jgi:hypothetical protein
MNTEFEWRSEMRKLGGPVEPQRDLWPSIAQRLEATPVIASMRSRHRHAGWIAIAATLVVAGGAGVTAYRWQRMPDAPAAVAAAPAHVAPAPSQVSAEPAPTSPAELPRTALEWAVPDDPALVATAQNLDNASAQLQGALEQRPDAVFLVGLLNRTNAMRLRLMRKAPAG